MGRKRGIGGKKKRLRVREKWSTGTPLTYIRNTYIANKFLKCDFVSAEFGYKRGSLLQVAGVIIRDTKISGKRAKTSLVFKYLKI